MFETEEASYKQNAKVEVTVQFYTDPKDKNKVEEIVVDAIAFLSYDVIDEKDVTKALVTNMKHKIVVQVPFCARVFEDPCFICGWIGILHGSRSKRDELW